jgi:hypothetical protein
MATFIGSLHVIATAFGHDIKKRGLVKRRNIRRKREKKNKQQVALQCKTSHSEIMLLLMQCV